MNEVRNFVRENRWAYVATMAVLWATVWGALEVTLSDGGLVIAMISGTAGGIASGVILFTAKQ